MDAAPYVEGVEPLDKFQLAYKRGARAAIAEDVEEFEYLPEEWGYPGEAVRDAVLEFNRQCEAGEPSPPRELDAAPLVDPPYYVIEVIPAITATWTGLRIDEHARVLTARAPDPGPARRRLRRRRRVQPRLRGRAGERAGVRARGGGDRHRRCRRGARELSPGRFKPSRSAPRC